MAKDAEIIGHVTVWSAASLSIIFLGGWGLILGLAIIYSWIVIEIF